MSSQLIFSVKDALVRYKETPVFENLDLNIHQGSRIALVGKNGAGKSTIMNIITGVRSPDEYYADNVFLPRARLRLSIFLPALVADRKRNPWRRFLTRLLG